MKFSDLKPGMIVSFSHGNIRNWQRIHERWVRDDNYQGPESRYIRDLKRYENVPLEVISNRERDLGLPGPLGLATLTVRVLPTDEIVKISNSWFPDENAFTLKTFKENARDVRNARLVGMRQGLDYGSESVISSFLSGEKGNAAQQGDKLREKAGVPFVAPDRKKLSGGKTRRKRRRTTRKH